MKKLIASLFVALCATIAFAQSSLLATLSHEGSVMSFYGPNALKEAYNTSVDGDIITLSSGQFNATDIAKGITIRGAGMYPDEATNRDATVISGEFTIRDSVTNVILEGLYLKNTTYFLRSVNAEFVKCFVNYICANDAQNATLSFIQSYINSTSFYVSTNHFVFDNCIIKNQYYKDYSSHEFRNCILYEIIGNQGNCIYTNCIFVINGRGYSFPYQSQASNCIAVGDVSEDYFGGLVFSTNKVIQGYYMFKSFTGEFKVDANFELTEEAKSTLLGSDDTEVGIYGGWLPFNPTPNAPQITKFNVAKRSTADGKLSVDIQVGVNE